MRAGYRKARHRRDQGAAAVEMALLLPLLLLIVFGIIDYGRMLNAQITLTEAAREGARAEALGASDEERDARIAELAANLGDVTTDPVQTCPEDPDAEIDVTYQFTFITPISSIAAIFGGGLDDAPVTLTGKGVMPCFS